MNIMEKRKKYSVVNLFTKHPRDNANETWWEHFKFTFKIGIRLLLTSIYFITHGIFPFIKINKKYNLTDTSKWLNLKNKNRQKQKKA